MTIQTAIDRQVEKFDLLAERARKIYEASADKSAKTLEAALRQARNGLEAAGEFRREEGESLESWLRRDLQLAHRNAKAVGSGIKEEFDSSGVSSSVLGLAATVLQNTGETLQAWAAKADEATSYRTGEVTGPGTLSCKRCDTELRMAESSKIPPCPKCHATDFRKSF